MSSTCDTRTAHRKSGHCARDRCVLDRCVFDVGVLDRSLNERRAVIVREGAEAAARLTAHVPCPGDPGVKAAGRAAAAALVAANQSLVASVARPAAAASGMDLEDLMQEGTVGMLKAAERFDPSRGARFSTWARIWVRREVLLAAATQARLVRLPSSAVADLDKIRAVLHRLGDRLDYDVLSSESGLAPERVRVLLEDTQRPLSLDSADSDGLCLAEVLAVPPDADVASPDRAGAVARALDLLSERERFVLEGRFGMRSAPLLQREIAEELGVSAERIRQIEKRALARLVASRQSWDGTGP